MPPRDFARKIDEFLAAARASSADGLTVAEFAMLTVQLARLAIAAADELEAAGATKKAWVLDATAGLFDLVADRMIPTVAWPAWLLLRPAARALTLAAVAGAIEALLPLVRLAT
jgi:hypothetical protein